MLRILVILSAMIVHCTIPCVASDAVRGSVAVADSLSRPANSFILNDDVGRTMRLSAWRWYARPGDTVSDLRSLHMIDSTWLPVSTIEQFSATPALATAQYGVVCLPLTVDSSLAGKPVVLIVEGYRLHELYYMGLPSMEIWFAGANIGSIGVPSSRAEYEISDLYRKRYYFSLTLPARAGVYPLALRYSWFENLRFIAKYPAFKTSNAVKTSGVVLRLAQAETADKVRRLDEFDQEYLLICCIFCVVITLIHGGTTLLTQREFTPLLLVGCTLSSGLQAFANYIRVGGIYVSKEISLLNIALFISIANILSGTFLVLMIFRLTRKTIPRFVYVALALFIGLRLIMPFWDTKVAWQNICFIATDTAITYGRIVLIIGEILRILRFERQKESWILIGGTVCYLIGSQIQAYSTYRYMLMGEAVPSFMYIISRFGYYMAMPLAVSAILALRNAETNIRLQRYNEELETAVQQRTKQLSETNTQLEHTNTQLQELHTEKRDFLSMVVHDIKNPMSVISAANEMLKEELHHRKAQSPEDKTEQKESLNNEDLMLGLTKQAVMQIEKMLSDLREVNQLEEGGVRGLHIQPVHFQTIIEQILATNLLLAEKKQQTLILQKEHPSHDQDLIILADPDAVIHIMDNLVSNAIKYSPLGGTITLILVITDTQVQCYIRDAGKGIPPNDIPFLFGKYKRLSPQPTGGETSSGLGLFIAKRMTEQMQGDLRYTGQYGEYGCFEIAFPRVQSSATTS
jgi:signal transduction histidine kinase